jgi:selenocysteine lyase/cysteine desulfurase
MKRDKLNFIYSKIAEHEEELSGKVLDYLNSRNDIRIIGSTEYKKEIRVPTIAFIKEGRDSEQLCLETDKHRVAIRWGHFYAKRLVDGLGLSKSNNGVVRISMVHYNTPEEADRLIKALDKSL